MKNMSTEIRRNIEAMTGLKELEIVNALDYDSVLDMRAAMRDRHWKFTLRALATYGPKVVGADSWQEAAVILKEPYTSLCKITKIRDKDVVTTPPIRLDIYEERHATDERYIKD